MKSFSALADKKSPSPMPNPSPIMTESPKARIVDGYAPDPIPPRITAKVFTAPSSPPYISDFKYSPAFV